MTFETVPILLAAYLFGPVDSVLVGGVGTLIYQLIRYGYNPNTYLWVLPGILCGLVVGIYCKKKGFNCTNNESLLIILIGQGIVFALNTVAIFVDSKAGGYFYEGIITESIVSRFIVYLSLGLIIGALVPYFAKLIRARILREKHFN